VFVLQTNLFFPLWCFPFGHPTLYAYDGWSIAWLVDCLVILVSWLLVCLFVGLFVCAWLVDYFVGQKNGWFID
jgi:hypothetical protein